MATPPGPRQLTTARMALAEDGKFFGHGLDLMGDMGAYLSTLRSLYSARRRRHLPAFTIFRRSMPPSDVSPTRCRSTPIAAPDGLSRPMWSSVWSTHRRENSDDARCDPAQELYRAARDALQDPTGSSTIPATSRAHETGQWRIANWKEFPKARQGRKEKKAWCAASDLALTSKFAAPWAKRRQCGARSQWRRDDPDRYAVERAGSFRLRTRNWSPSSRARARARPHFPGRHDRIATVLAPGGSASIPTGGVSVERATRTLGANLREIAATRWKPARRSRDQRGYGAIAGTDAPSSLRIWQAARRRSSKLKRERNLHQRRRHLPERTHLAEVEIDPATGKIAIVNYVVVDDFGVTLNRCCSPAQIMAARCRASARP